ncbi:hypothetical protein [uncultured phage_Deep-GF0-KM16-C193]|uniref:Uncharacterized protein n=1 Tax=uncultured phage_Deep-GF0-KM16-C193 TaxID=2740799 RepID=A0A1B1IWQ5_9CAUD|nr:hypothetical protein HOU06_gp29 [uncultured phage_Deep-GF0-KM16-C193]ANS05763.1 hypothetical protein [uncultured phage_Deep-GF0-KM16-C193]
MLNKHQLQNAIKALDNFVYTDTEGVKDNHLKQLPLKSKKLFIKIVTKWNNKIKNGIGSP